jgi:DNA-binding MarR family transcriptional regulator
MNSTRKAASPPERPRSLVPLIIADIYQLADQLRRNAEAIARPHAQSQARWHVLSAASADPKTVPQIARRLGVGRQNVQRIADLLVGEGLASFEPNPDHRTSPYLILADEGRAVLRELTQSARAYHQELAADQSEADLALLHRGLRRLCDALDRRENGIELEA